MIAPDANLLIFAHNPTSPFHRKSRIWFEDVLSGSEPVGLPAPSVYAFLRFMTNQAIQPRPATFAQAAAIVESWLAMPHVRILHPGDSHWEILLQLGTESRASGNFVTDVVIAAIAMEHHAAVYTHDHHFARFAKLQWRNPLQS